MLFKNRYASTILKPLFLLTIIVYLYPYSGKKEQERTVFPRYAAMKTLDYIREFYLQYGIPLIRDNFPEYQERIAVGVVGEGSDAFKYDDEISLDHDMGLGFCMWLKAEDYGKIGERLNNLYCNLLSAKGKEFAHKVFGEKAEGYYPRYDKRRGVFEISDFYKKLLRVKGIGLQGLLIGGKVYNAEECLLAAAVNGEVFRDDEGTFTAIRNRLLNHYPEKIRRLKIAEELHYFSQGGQSNYPRMMARGDYVAARLSLDLALRSALHLAYLLNKTYMPYYKWQRRGLKDMEKLRLLGDILDAVCLIPVQKGAWASKAYDPRVPNMEDGAVVLLEQAAALILSELNAQGIVSGEELFLEAYVGRIVEAS